MAAIAVPAAILAAVALGGRALEKAARPVAKSADGAARAAGVPLLPGAQPIFAHAHKGNAVIRCVIQDDPRAVATAYCIAMARRGWREVSRPGMDLGEDVLAFAQKRRLCIISMSQSRVNPGTTVTIVVREAAGRKRPGPPYKEKRP